MVVETRAMDHIRNVLEQFGDKYFTKRGELKINTVIEDLDKYDKELMSALLKDDLLHKTYTSKIANVEIFEVNKFVDMLRYKEYWKDSFTKYNNKIGLTAGGKYIDDSSDVVLDFPYKDCVLKAGMTKEEVERFGDANEPFLNEVLAKPEIDELFEPKIFVNATRYTENGGLQVSSVSDDSNLFINGNNLISLYSLEKRYYEKVKFVYLDPPYNTGSDTFKYNDKFNETSWLTFMKNRLEIIKKLLREDGSIYISIDENEFAYLKLLMNDIFGKDNDLITFHIQVRYTNKSLNEKNDFQPVMEYGIYYAKNKRKFIPNKPYDKYDISKFCFKISETEAPSQIIQLGGKKVAVFLPGQYKLEEQNPSLSGLKATWASGSILKGNTSGKFFNNYLSKRKSQDGLNVLYKVYGIGEDGLGYRYFTGPKKESAIRGQFYSGIPLDKVEDIKSGKARKYKPILNYYDFSGDVGNIRQEGDVPLNSGKKPERLLNMLLKIATNKNDLVLDPFAGSGTTAAICLKEKRRFITLEQINNQVNLTKKRLINVINGDQTGISKLVNWQGGGSFIYTELMEKNQIYLRDIQNAKDMDMLMSIYSRMKQNSDIDFRVDLNKFEASLKAGEFFHLGDRKKELTKIIEKNQLYYNYSDIDDKNVRNLISNTDYKFNKSFYSSSEAGE